MNTCQVAENPAQRAAEAVALELACSTGAEFFQGRVHHFKRLFGDWVMVTHAGEERGTRIGCRSQELLSLLGQRALQLKVFNPGRRLGVATRRPWAGRSARLR